MPRNWKSIIETETVFELKCTKTNNKGDKIVDKQLYRFKNYNCIQVAVHFNEMESSMNLQLTAVANRKNSVGDKQLWAEYEIFENDVRTMYQQNYYSHNTSLYPFPYFNLPSGLQQDSLTIAYPDLEEKYNKEIASDDTILIARNYGSGYPASGTYWGMYWEYDKSTFSFECVSGGEECYVDGISKKFIGGSPYYDLTPVKPLAETHPFGEALPQTCLTDNAYFLVAEFLTGKNGIPKPTPFKKFNTDFTLYVDGNQRANLKLTWHGLDSYYSNDAKVKVSAVNLLSYDRVDLGTYDYLSENMTTSYDQLLEYADPTKFEQFLSKILSLTGLPSVGIEFECSTSTDWSGVFYANIPVKGEGEYIKEYGLSDTSVDNGSLTIIYGTGNNDDPDRPDDPTPSDPDNPSDPVNPNDPTINTLGMLTTTYVMTPTRLQQLGNVLWNSSFMENIQLVNNSPIENIISVKLFPFILPSSSDTEIKVGNVDMGVNGQKVANNYNYRKTVGSISVVGKYSSFLDFAPFTKLTVFLPFIGYKELDPQVFMNRTLKIDYVIDLLTGACKAILYANSIPVSDYDGTIGVDIPITANNRAQVEMGLVQGALGVVAQGMTGNVAGALSTGLSSAFADFHSESRGASSPSCANYTSMSCYLIYDRPVYESLSAFNHTNGRKCNISKTLSSLKGYTEVAENVDLSNVPCTASEREKLRSIMSSGFFL